MRVRWTTDAADDLERICDYIARVVQVPHRMLRRRSSVALRILRDFHNGDVRAAWTERES
jgi:plasmid stabilization system protein ParE